MGTRQTPGSVGLAQRGDGLGGNVAGVEGAVMVEQVDSETITFSPLSVHAVSGFVLSDRGRRGGSQRSRRRLAALFIKRDIRLASDDVKANPTLCNAVAAPWLRWGTASTAAPWASSRAATPAVSPPPSQPSGKSRAKPGTPGYPKPKTPTPPSAESQQPQWPGPGHHLIRGTALVDDGEQLDP